ncbi:MAG: magnesium transporter [Bacilli bacterium]|nr:magnesium transporter [Bacilli bacterium]MDD4734282.1 magnesium transporter [Bacilli bacterium]
MKERVELLIEEKKYHELKDILSKLNISDVAEILEDVKPQELVKIFRLFKKDDAADVFSYFPVEIQTELVTLFTDKEAASLIDEMYADDATDLLEEMPSNVVIRLLKNCSEETRTQINKLLKYPDSSAGSIMTVEYAELKENLTIEKAIAKLREEGEKYETVNTCFILDKKRKLVGSIKLQDILFAKPNSLISEIANKDFIYVDTLTDQEEVVQMFKKYDVTIMPVVDSEGRLVGIITIDDIVDIIEEEATEDIEKMAAISPANKPYLKTGVIETWKTRIVWLLLLMVSAIFTGKIINGFESSLAACTALTAFIPMLMDTGGNAGGQVSVSVIRGISLNEIELKDAFKIMWKEFRVAIISGITLVFANLIKMLIVDNVSMNIIIVVSLALFFTVIFAKIVGSVLPLIAKKIGFDPAVMASPLLTTIVDAISLLVYFKFATILLGI